jgi:hypothetical protein
VPRTLSDALDEPATVHAISGPRTRCLVDELLRPVAGRHSVDLGSAGMKDIIGRDSSPEAYGRTRGLSPLT